jgi:hypothetical protein
MSVVQRVHMPSLDGATEWVNSDPLGSAEPRPPVGLRVGYDRQCRWKAASLARAGIPACAVGAASAR